MTPELLANERVERGYTLGLYSEGRLVFSDRGHWLHPLFDLERFLSGHRDIRIEECLLHDVVVGRAAALLAARLGVKRLHAELLSRRAEPVLAGNRIEYTCSKQIERIGCRTEDMLAEVDRPEDAYTTIIRLMKEAR